MPIQSPPAKRVPERTAWMRGTTTPSPNSAATRRTEPPVASAMARSASVSLKTSVSSRGFAGPTLTKATRSPERSVCSPSSRAGVCAVNRPGFSSPSATVRSAPLGPTSVTASAVSAMVWRSIWMSRPAAEARSASSSSAGSFISQWARRRRRSRCGPPSRKPRAHSQAWSESRSATRPLSSRASTRSGWSPAPDITAEPVRTCAPTRRSHSPQFGGVCSEPGSSRVTGWRLPPVVMRAR